jgi:Tfp pilus assembly protein PilE
MSRADRRSARGAAAGNTLMELMLVCAVLGILVGWGAPRFEVAVEQTRVDQAASALRSVWLAERLSWLEHRTFSDDLGALAGQRFVDAALVKQGQPFVLVVEAADAQGFAISAERTGSSAWVGALDLDETGAITGSTQDGNGHVVTPAP